LTTQTIAALAERGYSSEQISALYGEPEVAVVEAVELEHQLAAGMRSAA
jgi:hypothetical protein